MPEAIATLAVISLGRWIILNIVVESETNKLRSACATVIKLHKFKINLRILSSSGATPGGTTSINI